MSLVRVSMVRITVTVKIRVRFTFSDRVSKTFRHEVELSGSRRVDTAGFYT